MKLLPREEYVEQAYLFRTLGHRIQSNDPVQVLLAYAKEEILATTKLPMAIDFLLAELNHTGSMATAMRRMNHYFTGFQTFLMEQCETERGQMDLITATQLLEAEARYRAEQATPVGLFFFQFEILCRHRLSYDRGLAAMARDPMYDESWKRWLLAIRQKLGIVDLADLVYVHSQYFVTQQQRVAENVKQDHVILFGEKEGRIALANRRKEPLYLFAALQRHLDYPAVPKRKMRDETEDIVPKLRKAVERLETRVKLLEDEQRQAGIDLNQFLEKPKPPLPLD